MSENYIRMVSEKCAKAINLSYVPRFFRWNRKRGWAHSHGEDKKFSLPRWITESDRDTVTLGIAYIAHEISHFGAGNGHDHRQRLDEKAILASWFIVPVYNLNESVYPTRFVDYFTNEILCDGRGRRPDHPLYGTR